MDVTPLPAAKVGTSAPEQGQGGRNVVLPPLLVGHLDRPTVVDPLDFLSLPIRLGPRLGLAVAGLLGGAPCLRLTIASFLRFLPCRHRVPPQPGQAPPEPRQDYDRRH